MATNGRTDPLQVQLLAVAPPGPFRSAFSNSRLNSNVLIPVLYAMGFYGLYPFLLTLHQLGLTSASERFTAPFRLVFLFVALASIVLGVSHRKPLFPNWALLLLFVFWGMLAFTLSRDSFFIPIKMRLQPSDYWIKSFGISCLPLFAFFIRLDYRTATNCFRFILFSLTVFAGLFFIFYWDNLASLSYRSLSYQGVDSETLISPITSAYTFATLYSLGLWALASPRHSRNLKIVCLLTTTASILAVGFLGTRGALLACVTTTAILFCPRPQRKYRSRHGAAPLLVLTIICIAIFSSNIMESTFQRLQVLATQLQTDNAEAGGGRGLLYANAYRQFSNSPLIGSHIEEQSTLYYPHNQVLEAFMTTGLIGGTAFLALFTVAGIRSLTLIFQSHYLGWIGVINIVTSVNAMFSGTITNSIIWYSIIAVIATLNVRENTASPLLINNAGSSPGDPRIV